jgi:hypothetical protein
VAGAKPLSFKDVAVGNDGSLNLVPGWYLNSHSYGFMQLCRCPDLYGPLASVSEETGKSIPFLQTKLRGALGVSADSF